MDKVEQIKHLAAQVVKDVRWASVLIKDASLDGQFYYAVKTTGVYCRPSCGARLPRPENVVFYSTITAAENAGFRACKRCKPDQLPLAIQQAEVISGICRWIESAETMPSLAQLAEKAGWSVYYFHRLFKSVTGLTPKSYANAQRAQRLREELHKQTTITDAIFEAGYQSNSRFYAESDKRLGMTPTVYRAGGQKLEIRFAIGECALGAILVASTARGVCAILMGDDPNTLIADLQDRFPQSLLIGGDAVFEQLVATVIGFVENPAIGLNLPLDIRGTAFQQRVWQALQSIPVGETVSYTDIARALGAPQAARAVALACGANSLAVAIPCHRVVRKDGAISGYRWGVERKRTLLAIEKNQKTDER